ncbi:phosphoribosylanthranilate isomerase [Hathewaya histolytica]|uniref:N-(5'-phosphoribosyl)anthranilate isomerase n=1 Tax=Hathewaya histolytica TaxID=1498 RepID=A0A4U9QX67_HATHI|nr:phosphoribosylanthranilate isomerase [Hathewaya histolytica]VTQ82381.1 N-(5'-phosphoribosyl)anthranilate isomerase TrpF [Hathewaya histolytica]
MTKIKICGLTRGEDIEYVNRVKPDFVGFVFAESKRRVSSNQCENLILDLDKNIKKVGVFVDESLDKVREIASNLKFDVLQFHGSETLEYLRNFSDFEIWKAIRVKGINSIKEIDKYKDYGVLLDAFSHKELGGTGEKFSWEISKALPKRIKIVLAGGLNSYNVEEGINLFNPYAVDVSSGVESNGLKDYNKIKKIIEKVRG